jgi:chromosome segregation ATPase
MKKVTITKITKCGTSILTLALITGVGVLNAQETRREEMPVAPRPAIEDRRERVEERRGTILERVGEARESFQENLEEVRLERAATIEEREVAREERAEKRQNRIEKRRQELEARRQEMISNREARKAELSEERKEKVKGLFDRMFSGFANTADRLSGISERLAAKISQLESEGVDVNEALSVLETADNLLEDTLAEIEAVQTELSEAIEGEITKEYVRELVSGAKESIRATHEAYRAVISEINSL